MILRGLGVRKVIENFGVPYGSRTRVAAVKGKRPIVIQRNLAAWIALRGLTGTLIGVLMDARFGCHGIFYEY